MMERLSLTLTCQLTSSPVNTLLPSVPTADLFKKLSYSLYFTVAVYGYSFSPTLTTALFVYVPADNFGTDVINVTT